MENHDGVENVLENKNYSFSLPYIRNYFVYRTS